MKRSSPLLICISILLAASTNLNAQEKTLPEVTVVSRNYKYLKSVNSSPSEDVKLLERTAAVYDVRNSGFYEDDYDMYYISFYLPSGYLLAVYDQSGKLLHTAEKYKDAALPSAVRNAVVQRYPNWGITDDIYLVTYKEEADAKLIYKLSLRNGNKRLKVKMNEKGDFLD